jgi:hypothetical protein
VSSRSVLITPTGNRTHDSSQVQPVVQSLYLLSYPAITFISSRKAFITYIHRSIFIRFNGSTTLVDLVLPSVEVSRSHTGIPHSVGIPLDE